jgi:hypothetical protein
VAEWAELVTKRNNSEVATEVVAMTGAAKRQLKSFREEQRWCI